MVKITQPDTIKLSEKEFIDTINAELDWGALESILRERHRLHLLDDVTYRGGDLVVHRDRIAYKLDFEIRLSLSVVVGRDGDCLEIGSSADEEPDRGMVPAQGEDDLDILDAEGLPGAGAPGGVPGDLAGMASSLAAMISDINRGGE
jgi:hypothetical protein